MIARLSGRPAGRTPEGLVLDGGPAERTGVRAGSGDRQDGQERERSSDGAQEPHPTRPRPSRREQLLVEHAEQEHERRHGPFAGAQEMHCAP